MIYHLHKWSVVASNPYAAPEVSHRSLHGTRAEDGQEITTSTIIGIQGRTITTHSGSTYILEDIDPEYLQWIVEQGYDYDPEHPIKDKRSN